MYASNLQELLFHCSEHSDVSPEAFADFTERFNKLRSYGHLPKGRTKRKQLLTPIQIASAILGLVPIHPAWAGHGATILKSLSPVGGPKDGFHNTASLIEAIALALTDIHARASLIVARIVLGQTGINSNGGPFSRMSMKAVEGRLSICRAWRPPSHEREPNQPLTLKNDCLLPPAEK